jgi:hypothetical protein
MRRLPVLLCVVPVFGLALAGCASGDGRELRDPGPTTTDPFAGEMIDGGGDPLTLSAPGVDDDGTIDPRHTCRGEDVSPELSWSGGPEAVASWAVVAEDESGGIRWIVVNLSPETRYLAAGETDPLAVVGENPDGRIGWSGPCPEPGETAEWSVTVFAVSQVLEAQTGDPAASLSTAVASAALESSGIGISVTG